MNKLFAVSLARSMFSAALCFGATGAIADALTLHLTKVRADDPTKPAAVPNDYVVTPFGYFDQSCIHQLDASESLREDGSIQGADGTIHKSAACTHAAFLRDGTRIEPNDEFNRMVRQPSTYNGYLQLISVLLGSGADKLTATMTVPGNPSSVAGQTVYLFPGLEDGQDVVSILQPVLGWNGFGANQWNISAWNCCKSGSVYVGSNTPVVNPGDLIYGEMISSSGQNWTVGAKDLTQKSLPLATLKTQSWGQTFDWIFAGALETYGVSSCNQFPSTGPVKFGSIKTYVGGQIVNNPSWSITSESGSPSSCTGATIVNSSTVDISY